MLLSRDSSREELLELLVGNLIQNPLAGLDSACQSCSISASVAVSFKVFRKVMLAKITERIDLFGGQWVLRVLATSWLPTLLWKSNGAKPKGAVFLAIFLTLGSRERCMKVMG